MDVDAVSAWTDKSFSITAIPENADKSSVKIPDAFSEN